MLKIIAGPCSIDNKNIKEIYALAKLEVKGKKAVWGTRVVGLKSRTAWKGRGKGMGIDFAVILENQKIMAQGGRLQDLKTPPSVKFAQKIVQDTGMLVGTEIMLPLIQIPTYACKIPAHKLLLWNPAVNQLGWPLWLMGLEARKNKWFLGIKNGKWVGTAKNKVQAKRRGEEIPIENVWSGLTTYARGLYGRLILIHRGFETEDKAAFRSNPLHAIAQRVKAATKAQLFFDPSHSYGPKLQDEIVAGTIAAMQMKANAREYLYDGALIEVGTAQTDSEQHISLSALKDLLQQLSTFRDLIGP